MFGGLVRTCVYLLFQGPYFIEAECNLIAGVLSIIC